MGVQLIARGRQLGRGRCRCRRGLGLAIGPRRAELGPRGRRLAAVAAITLEQHLLGRPLPLPPESRRALTARPAVGIGADDVDGSRYLAVRSRPRASSTSPAVCWPMLKLVVCTSHALLLGLRTIDGHSSPWPPCGQGSRPRRSVSRKASTRRQCRRTGSVTRLRQTGMASRRLLACPMRWSREVRPSSPVRASTRPDSHRPRCCEHGLTCLDSGVDIPPPPPRSPPSSGTVSEAAAIQPSSPPSLHPPAAPTDRPTPQRRRRVRERARSSQTRARARAKGLPGPRDDGETGTVPSMDTGAKS